MKASLLFFSVFLLAALATPGAARGEPGTYANEPGAIRHRADEGVSGSFRLEKDPGGTWSAGTGGGCLVADFSASLGDSRCVTNDDCLAYRDAFAAALPAGESPDGVYGYCARPGGSAEPARCWVRPGPQPEYCVVSPLAPLTLNQAVKIPAAPLKGVPASRLGDGKKVRWMVYTCLNGFDFGNPGSQKDRLGCRESDARLSTSRGGKVKTVNP